MAGSRAFVVATAQLPVADLIAGRAGAVSGIAAAALAGVPPAGAQLVAAPLARELLAAQHLLLRLAAPTGSRSQQGMVA